MDNWFRTARRSRDAAHGHLDARDRQRHRRHGQAARDPHACHSRARLPPQRTLPARVARRVEDRPARRSLPRATWIGAYAGEIGQTQFLPSSYIKYGVDYDGNGHVDLRHSVPDVLASTANLLKSNGWRAGAPFGEGTANFEVMREWNHSEVYRKTMVLFAERLADPDVLLNCVRPAGAATTT